MKAIIAGVKCEGTPEEIAKIMSMASDLSITCLSYECRTKIGEGNYCQKHAWDTNNLLPKPNNGETVMKA